MPVPSWVGPGIQGGVALGSTLLAGRQRPEERQAVHAGTDILNLGRGIATNLAPAGQGMIRQGIGTMQPSINYWRNLLAGGPATTAAASPDIQRINQQYNAVRQGQAELAPRGGGRATLLGDLPYQQMRDVSNTITQQRSAAAPALAQAGGQIAQTGSSTINSAISGLYATSEAGRGLLDYARQRQATDISQGRAIGGSILDIVKGVVPKLFGGGDGTGSVVKEGAKKAVGVGGSILGAATGAGAAPDLAAADAGVVGGGHGASSLLGIAAAHPLAALAIGAGVGGALLAKHFVGQGRRAADVLTGEGGMQHSFESALKEIDAMNIPDDQKWQHKQEAYNGLVKMGLQHAQKGDNERKVVSQMFQTISPLFGQSNPLGAV